MVVEVDVVEVEVVDVDVVDVVVVVLVGIQDPSFLSSLNRFSSYAPGSSTR